MVRRILAIGLGVLLTLPPVAANARADCVVTLKFGNESAALTGPVQALLYELAANHAGSKIEVLGNADMVANEPGNQALAVARAASVRAYLLARGMAETRVTIAPAPDDLLQLAGIAPLESRRFVLVRVGACNEKTAPGGAIVVITTTTTVTTIATPP